MLAGMQASSIQGRRVTRVGGKPGVPFVQQTGPDGAADDAAPAADPCAGMRSARACGRHPWADLLNRAFAVDVLRCACGGRRRILAAITQT